MKALLGTPHIFAGNATLACDVSALLEGCGGPLKTFALCNYLPSTAKPCENPARLLELIIKNAVVERMSSATVDTVPFGNAVFQFNLTETKDGMTTIVDVAASAKSPRVSIGYAKLEFNAGDSSEFNSDELDGILTKKKKVQAITPDYKETGETLGAVTVSMTSSKFAIFHMKFVLFTGGTPSNKEAVSFSTYDEPRDVFVAAESFGRVMDSVMLGYPGPSGVPHMCIPTAFLGGTQTTVSTRLFVTKHPRHTELLKFDQSTGRAGDYGSFPHDALFTTRVCAETRTNNKGHVFKLVVPSPSVVVDANGKLSVSVRVRATCTRAHIDKTGDLAARLYAVVSINAAGRRTDTEIDADCAMATAVCGPLTAWDDTIKEKNEAFPIGDSPYDRMMFRAAVVPRAYVHGRDGYVPMDDTNGLIEDAMATFLRTHRTLRSSGLAPVDSSKKHAVPKSKKVTTNSDLIAGLYARSAAPSAATAGASAPAPRFGDAICFVAPLDTRDMTTFFGNNIHAEPDFARNGYVLAASAPTGTTFPSFVGAFRKEIKKMGVAHSEAKYDLSDATSPLRAVGCAGFCKKAVSGKQPADEPAAKPAAAKRRPADGQAAKPAAKRRKDGDPAAPPAAE